MRKKQNQFLQKTNHSWLWNLSGLFIYPSFCLLRPGAIGKGPNAFRQLHVLKAVAIKGAHLTRTQLLFEPLNKMFGESEVDIFNK